MIYSKTNWEFKSSDPYYITETQNTISIRIKPNSPDPYLFAYSFKPSTAITMFPRIAGISLFICSMALLVFNLELFESHCKSYHVCDLITPIQDKHSDFVIAVIATSLIIAGFIQNVEIRNRMKLLFFVPIVISILSLYSHMF